MSTLRLRRWPAVLLAAWCSTAVAGIGYVASAKGLVLQVRDGVAVMAPWRGESPIQGFSGYGQVHANGLCLAAYAADEPLRWEGCRFGDRAQVWKFTNQRLGNELEVCAQRQHEGDQARVLGARCTGEATQRWQPWSSASARSAAAFLIADPGVREQFLHTVARAVAGSVVSLRTGRLLDPAAVHAGSVPGPKALAVGGGDVIPLR